MIIGQKVFYLEKTTSTNDEAWKLASDGAKDGTVIFASEQTMGRGRFGRNWHSTKGEDVIMSVILRPKLRPEQIGIITALGAVAVTEATRLTCKLEARVRFPNDVLVNNKKLAGILVESRSVGDTPDTFIIGIGVNVNSTKFPAEIPDATSIAIETGKKINQSVIQRAVMNKLDELYTDLSWERIRDIYVKRSSLTGVRVIVKEQGKETSGICEHADPVDGILLRMESGYTQRIRPEWVEYIRPL